MNLTTFNFKDNAIRSMMDEQGNPWFVAADVCKVLEIGNVSQAMTRLDGDETSDITTNDTSSNGVTQNRKVTIINESGLYSLILTSRKPEAKSFKKWVTSEVLPSIRKTGGYSVTSIHQSSRIPLDEIARSLEVANNMLNVCPSGKLKSLRQLYDNYGVNSNILPAYAIDAPTVTAGSSEPTLSLTEILKRTNTPLSATVANRKLHELGLLKQNSRKSSSGLDKHFWVITDAGMKYGKNLTSDKNQRETQPHWYSKTMQELVDLIK